MKRYIPLILILLTLSSALAQIDSGADALLRGIAFFFAGIWIFIFFMILLMIASIIAFIWALIDILKTKNKEDWKIMWVLVTFFFGIIGVILYLIIGRKQRRK